MEATFRHRYELSPDGDGCRLDCTLAQGVDPPPHPALPLGAGEGHGVELGIPIMVRRSCRNLIRTAERREGS